MDAVLKSRQYYNELLVTILSAYIEEFPGIRLNQALFNLNINRGNKDLYNEESRCTFLRVLAGMERMAEKCNSN